MSQNGALFRIVPVAAVTAAASPAGVNGAFPATALANIQPKVVARSGTTGSPRVMVIDIDLGADTAVDAVAGLHTNLALAADWQIYGRTSAAGAFGAVGTEIAGERLFGQTGYTVFGVAPTTRESRRFALAFGGPHSLRHVRVYLREPTAAFVEIGTLLVLQRLSMGQDAYGNYELGSGRRVEDRSQVRGLPGGETVIERGGRVPQWRAAWSNLTEAQYRDLWSLLMDVGIGAPVLAAEFQAASTGQAEALHYGLITAIDFSERVQIDKQRVELRFQELV